MREAEEILKNANKASNDHAETVYNQTQLFQKGQDDIDLRLMLVTQSDNSDEAARKFEVSMDKLRRLEVAKGYMELLNAINDLKSVPPCRGMAKANLDVVSAYQTPSKRLLLLRLTPTPSYEISRVR